MASDADVFEKNLDSFKEFVDDDGRHFYVVYFEDGSGRILKKRPSEDDRSMAEFVVRDRFAKDGMRMISEATDFEFDDDLNTQRNLANLVEGS